LQRKSLLEVGYALDLSCYQYHAVEQERWPTLFDDSNAFVIEITMTGWRYMDLDACGKYDSAVTPDVGMQDEWHVVATDTLKDALESTVMIRMTMRENNGT
jgi:hypothetical protein